MDEYRRMAAVMLVLILVIADLTLALMKEFDENEIKRLKHFKNALIEEPAGEVWTAESAAETEQNESEQEETAAKESAPATEKAPLVTREPVIPLADHNDQSGAQSMIRIDGRLEGLVDKKVFQVSLPVESTEIEYIADPQGLICRSGYAAYEESWFDPEANVYFNRGKISNSSGKDETCYTDTSPPFKVVNKSSCAVSVVARLFTEYPAASGVRVPLTADRQWDDNKNPGIFLAAERSDDKTETVLDRSEKILTASIPGCPGAYCCKYEGPETYSYQLMTDEELAAFRSDPKNENVNTEFASLAITLKGECSRSAEWDPDEDYVFPSVSVIWNVGLADSAKPAVTQKTVSVAGNDPVEISYSFGILDDAADAITTAYYVTPEDERRDLRWNGYYLVFEDDRVTLTPEFLEYVRERNGGVLRLRFNDPSETVEEIVLDTDSRPGLDLSEFVIESGGNKTLTIGYDLGTGEKAAKGIASMSFGKTDLLTSSYSSVKNGTITLNAGAVRMMEEKNGGKIVVTFDDAERTRCIVRIKTDK